MQPHFTHVLKPQKICIQIYRWTKNYINNSMIINQLSSWNNYNLPVSESNFLFLFLLLFLPCFLFFPLLYFSSIITGIQDFSSVHSRQEWFHVFGDPLKIVIIEEKCENHQTSIHNEDDPLQNTKLQKYSWFLILLTGPSWRTSCQKLP